MKAEFKNNLIKKHTINNMMMAFCMPLHQEYCG